jgi:hypothetical protein
MNLTANVPENNQNYNNKRLRIAIVKILKNNSAADRTVHLFPLHTEF